MKLSEINEMPLDSLIECFGGIYEHSPWVIERAAMKRPFFNLADCIKAMRDVVEHATHDERYKLICAHPDLAGKMARAGNLTEESTREQVGLGLDQLSDEEFETLSNLNASYRDKFGMPFVICARLTTKRMMLENFRARLMNDRTSECLTAIEQIHQIARLRIEDRVEDENL